MHHALGDGVSFGFALTVQLADDFGKVTLERGTSLRTWISFVIWLLWGSILVILRWMWMTIMYPRLPKPFQSEFRVFANSFFTCQLDRSEALDRSEESGLLTRWNHFG